ncbi:hypothetical protein [Flavobacterium sp. 3HN19-14]|uniref:hypothetical protein n=1 Tax=Flavobacterium sp. 3HN19-14 TaxID=3448133 RepID=UPI003EE30C6E
MRKIILFTMFLAFCSVYAQKKKVVLVFSSVDKNMSFKNKCFYIDNQSFKYFAKNASKQKVKYKAIKKEITSIADLNREIKGNLQNKKNPEFYYDNYTIAIYVADNAASGTLYPVKRVWIIDEVIEN